MSATIRSICLVLVILAVFYSFRSKAKSGIRETTFWSQKRSWNQHADLVFAGDSRVLRAISPEYFSSFPKEVRVLNTAFPGVGYDEQYLAYLERVIDPASSYGAIVLGITPNSLTESAARKNGFLASPTTGLTEGFLSELVDEFQTQTRALTLAEASRWLTGKRSAVFQEFTPNGWVATVGPSNESDGLRIYEEIFTRNRVSNEVVDGLLSTVQSWVQKGIRTFGFRAFGSTKLTELENSMSGFNEQEFHRRFEEAGGIWIDMSGFPVVSYDASHLDRANAIKWTEFMQPKLHKELAEIGVLP
jgi:hypothetical protein